MIKTLSPELDGLGLIGSSAPISNLGQLVLSSSEKLGKLLESEVCVPPKSYVET